MGQALRVAGAPLGACLLVAPASASAAELIGTGPLGGATLQFTEDFETRYWMTDRKLPGFEDRRIHDYVEQVNRLNVLLSQRWDRGDGLSVGVQVDEVALFSNRYILDGVLQHSWELYDDSVSSPWPDALIHLEKGYAQYRWKQGEVVLGDGYASFGRGIALNIKKNTDVDIDTSLFGARTEVRLGEFEVSLVSGLSNRQQVSQDQPNLGIFDDVRHMVSGVRLARYALGPADLGAHGVVYRFGRDTDAAIDPMARYAEPLDAAVTGADLALYGVGGLDLYLEGDLFAFLSPEMVGEVDEGSTTTRYGHAVYASGSMYPGNAVLLVEAKHSRDTERINAFVTVDGWEVATVPSLEYERVITEDSSAAMNSNDVYGGRVRLDYTLAEGGFVPYLSLMSLRDEDVDTLHFNRSPETIGHGVAGFTLAGGTVTAQLNAGVRLDIRDDAAEGQDRLLHLDGDVSVPLGAHDRVELALGGKQFAWGENVQDQSDFLEMENALVWHRGEHLSVSLYQDYSDNPLVQSDGNLSKTLYGAGELGWHPGPNTSLKAFFGAYKAGIRCSGGQCRSMPGFEGGRVSFTSTF